MQYSVLIPAAGSGHRMGLGFNKIFYQLNQKTIIEQTVSVFLTDENCVMVVLVISAQDEERMKTLFKDDSKIILVLGGSDRQASVLNGLNHITTDIVLVHDGARPYLTRSLLDEVLFKMETAEACLPMVAVKDTIKMVKDMRVIQTLERDTLMQAQTPQAFKTKMIQEAHQRALKDGIVVSDDTSLIEHYQLAPVEVVIGDYRNIKITTKEDLQGMR